MNAASASGTSAQKTSWKRCGSTDTSTLPSGNGVVWRKLPIASDGKRACRSVIDSPSSGTNPATYTSPATLSEAPATVITQPAYEWPTSTTGPSSCSMTAPRYEASLATPRRGSAAARIVCSSPSSRSNTARQLEASPKAPCTRTIVGLDMGLPFACEGRVTPRCSLRSTFRDRRRGFPGRIPGSQCPAAWPTSMCSVSPVTKLACSR